MAKRKGSTGIEVALRYKRFSELRKQGLKVEDIGKIVGSITQQYHTEQRCITKTKACTIR